MSERLVWRARDITRLSRDGSAAKGRGTIVYDLPPGATLVGEGGLGSSSMGIASDEGASISIGKEVEEPDLEDPWRALGGAVSHSWIFGTDSMG